MVFANSSLFWGLFWSWIKRFGARFTKEVLNLANLEGRKTSERKWMDSQGENVQQLFSRRKKPQKLLKSHPKQKCQEPKSGKDALHFFWGGKATFLGGWLLSLVKQPTDGGGSRDSILVFFSPTFVQGKGRERPWVGQKRPNMSPKERCQVNELIGVQKYTWYLLKEKALKSWMS